jgi:hypothetical protein
MSKKLAVIFVSAVVAGNANATTQVEMIAARQKIFGIENVDPVTGALPTGKVLFSWMSNSSFAAAIEGRMIYLDTYVTRLEVTPGRISLVIKDMVDAKPEAILLGHGHSDHADNAAYIAAKTGATVYATEETCGAMQQDFARMAADPYIQNNDIARFNPTDRVRCVNVTSAGSVPATESVRLDVLEPVACVTAFRHLHSVSVPPDSSFPPTPVKIIVDPRDADLFPKGESLTPGRSATPQIGQMDLTTGGGSGPGGPASLLYDFVLRNAGHFTFVWHNTAGALKEGKGAGWNGTPADGQRIIARLKALPPTDVQMGTASSANFDNNGLRDLIMYQQALAPKIYIPNHLTTGTATREASSMSVYAGYKKQLALMGVTREQAPDIRWLIDPTDYLKPIVFDINDPQYKDPRKDAYLAQACSGPMTSPTKTQ